MLSSLSIEFEQQEEKNGKLKKRGRGKLSSQSYDTRSLSTDPTVVQSTLPPSLPSLNSFSSMLPTTVTGMLIPRDDISISSTMVRS